MNVDGTNQTSITEGSDDHIQLVGDWIYFISRGGDAARTGIYRVKTDGTNKMQLTPDFAYNLYATEDWIYYSDKNGFFYKYNGREKEKVKINEDWARDIHIMDEWIYYRNQPKKGPGDGDIIRIKSDGSQREVFIPKL